MLTTRRIEKLWEARDYQRIFNELISPRVEALAMAELGQGSLAAAAAALALIRLDELHQAHASICPKLIRALVAIQDADGGWGDVATTALCVRALSLQNGQGLSIDRGLAYLADLQQAEGTWPKIPIRRMPADAMVSAFVLLQLGDNLAFRNAVDFTAACRWFETNHWQLDAGSQVLWDHARLRVPACHTTPAGAEASWS
jgi:hypothetical protein